MTPDTKKPIEPGSLAYIKKTPTHEVLKAHERARREREWYRPIHAAKNELHRITTKGLGVTLRFEFDSEAEQDIVIEIPSGPRAEASA